MSAENQSPESLFAQLTSFSIEQDAEFRRGDSDIVTRTRKVGRFVGTLYDEELDQEVPLYDEKTITFTAERVITTTNNRRTIPGRFTIGLETRTPVDAIPPEVLPYIDADIIEFYNETEPGYLYVSFDVNYTVERAFDLDVDITRNMTYRFYDNDKVLYQASEADETNKFEQVPIAHDQKTLLVRRPVQEEAVADAAEQLQFNVLFDDMFDGANVEFYRNFLTARDHDAIASIRSLLRALKIGATTPEI